MAGCLLDDVDDVVAVNRVEPCLSFGDVARDADLEVAVLGRPVPSDVDALCFEGLGVQRAHGLHHVAERSRRVIVDDVDAWVDSVQSVKDRLRCVREIDGDRVRRVVHHHAGVVRLAYDSLDGMGGGIQR